MHHTHKYYLKILKFKFILHRVFTSRFSFTVYFTQQINKGVNRYNIYFIFKYSVEIKNNLLSTLLYIYRNNYICRIFLKFKTKPQITKIMIDGSFRDNLKQPGNFSWIKFH